MRILVVEDERRMAELLRQGLTEDGHAVTVALNGRDGLAFAEAGGMSGLQIARQLGVCRDRTPILRLTARDAASDIVQGLDIGADDYLTKPFSFEVLLARVRAVGRRGPIAQPVVLETAGLTLHLGTREVRRASSTTAPARASPSTRCAAMASTSSSS
jgi:DNA-binding response OmpR family regulator